MNDYFDNYLLNKEDKEKMTFDGTVSQSLSKNCDITTSHYYYDEDSFVPDDYDFDVEYIEQHLTALDLIEEFKNLLLTLQVNGTIAYQPNKHDHLLKECEGWDEDEFCVEI
jgi:hypothetical protein